MDQATAIVDDQAQGADVPAPAVDPVHGGRRSGRSRRLLTLTATWSIVGLVLLIAIGIGWDARIYLWNLTEKSHYAPDMRNAYYWGSRANDEGFVGLYERVLAEKPSGKYGLDYVPLRLLIMTRWVAWTREADPGTTSWQFDYAFNAPLLRLNAVMELAAALAAFAIVYVWNRRRISSLAVHEMAEATAPAGSSGIRTTYHFWVLPIIAFLLAWFNPASLVSAHARPTWDVWVVPFYLAAVLCAMGNAWFITGVLIGVGAMLKGQQFIVAPLFVLWPILLWQWGAAVRAAVGCALAVGLVVTPWMLTYAEEPGVRVADKAAIAWIAGGLAAACVVIGWRFMVPWMLRRWRATLGALAAAVMLVPALILRADLWWAWAVLSIALAAALALLPLRMQSYTLAGILGGGLLLCMELFHGSDAWFKIAFQYGGMQKYPGLEVGGTASLAGLLQNVYGWQHKDIVFTWGTTEITMHKLLISVFAVLLVVSIVALAVHYARRSGRFLVAVATPWIVFFAVAPLMHERYLLWGAMAAAVAVGAGWGPALLGIFFSVVSWIMSVRQMMGDGRGVGLSWWPTLGEDIAYWIGPTIPDISWAVLLAAASWLYLTITPERRREIGRPL